MPVIEISNPKRRALPAQGMRDTWREAIDSVAAHIDEAPDDSYKSRLQPPIAAACNALEKLRADAWSTADTALRRYARNEGVLQGALDAVANSPNVALAFGVADRQAALNGERARVDRTMQRQIADQVFASTKTNSAQLASDALAALKDLEKAIKRVRAKAQLPAAMSADVTLLDISKQAQTEQQIRGQRRPAQYVYETWRALLDSDETDDAAFFADCARHAMIEIRDTPPPRLTARYANASPDTVASEREMAFRFLSELEGLERRALNESSLGFAERCFGTLRDLWQQICGVHQQWMTPAQRRSTYAVDTPARDRWDQVTPDWPMRFIPPNGTPPGWSPIIAVAANKLPIRKGA